MKKFTLFSFVFILSVILLGFNAKSASATNCAPGDSFSSVTGQPCNANSASVVKCPTGDLFSSVTGKACTAWQAENDFSLDRELKIGSRGEDVKKLQQLLKELGILLGKIDGSYGPVTARAVKKYQQYQSITATGVVNPKTMQVVNTAPIPQTCNSVVSTEGITKYICPTNPQISTNPSAMKVVSPNGGETWAKGTTQTITWLSSARMGASVNISLYPSCTTGGGNECSDDVYSSYTIYKGAPNTGFYNWTIPNCDTGSECSSNFSLPEGAYTVKICRTVLGAETQIGEVTCDSSDSYFKITSGSTSVNRVPVIGPTGIPAGISVGQSVSFSFNATDADNDDLSWSVDWGDNSGGAGACQSNPPAGTGQNWNYNPSHAWNTAGSYLINVSVSDCKGGVAKTSFTVNVGSTTQPSITVLSPNGGETWALGSTQTISWLDTNNISTHEVKLVPYYPPCTTYPCPAYPYHSPYTITNTQGSSYNWPVGVTWENNSVPDGSYTIQVCQSSTDVCDSSNLYFKIISS